MSSDKFFSKSYTYPTIWAIIVGVLSFLTALIWKNLTGPDEVLILNSESHTKDTTVTIIRFQPDEKYFESLNNLTSKNMTNFYAKDQSSKKKKDIDSLSLAISKRYQLKFDSIRLSLKAIQTPTVDGSLVSIPSGGTNFNNAQLKRPLFRMPSIVRGYIENKINSYASFSLSTAEFKRNEKIQIAIDFFNKSVVDKITPLFVEVVEPKTTNSVYHIWGDQYQIIDLKSRLTISADFKPGKYLLTIGFYFLDEVNTEYPELYTKGFNIEIK